MMRFRPKETPVVILTDGFLGQPTAKLAIGVLRFGQWPVLAVIDSGQAGKTVGEVIPFLNALPERGKTPVVASLQEVLSQHPKALILGTAPIGGEIPPHWREIIKQAITQGLHIISGMHHFLKEDAELANLASQHHVYLWDVRDPHYDQKALEPNHWWPISQQKQRPNHVKVITMVGTDCSVGKMFTALCLTEAAQKAGLNAEFVATGQTGILISGRGVPLDRVIGDYMAGYMESCVFQAIERDAEWIFVEGQGSLAHPAYSGVTLSLVHGSRPDAMILCHEAGRTHIRGGYETPILPLPEIIQRYESATAWAAMQYPAQAKIAGISLNCAKLSESDAQAACAIASLETGLPTTDPIRFGAERLIQVLQERLL